MERLDWPRESEIGWAADWIGLVKDLGSDGLNAGKRVDRRQGSGPQYL